MEPFSPEAGPSRARSSYDLVLLLDNIVAECEATKTQLAGLEQRGASQEGWVVTKLQRVPRS